MRLLDLFCCQGGAARGYSNAGFHVTGVDIEPQPRYPYRFFQGDALEHLKQIGTRFNFIHASPPCQGYSHLTPRASKGNHELLIGATRTLLRESGVHFCIENVPGAKNDLGRPFMLCGSQFGLRTRRHRFFETTFPVRVDDLPPCDHSVIPLLVTTASKASRAKRAALGMPYKSVKNAPLAYGIDWMNFNGLKEAIPPAYTEWIGRQFLRHTQ